MKIVIEIPEETYSFIKENSSGSAAHEAIANGTPLPKTHGRLIDAIQIGWDYSNDQIRALQKLPPAQQWIPVTSRPMDAEERLEWSEKTGYDIEDSEALIYTSQLPDDGEEVLTCDRYGNVRIDTFENDPDYGCYFEENGDMDGIAAWMPLPEPYKAESEAENGKEIQ